MKCYGLTGGMGSGKSTFAKILQKQGALLVDADQVARELRAPGGKAHAAIMSRFGTDEPGKLREILSQDVSAKKDLESILHPLIREASDAQIQALMKEKPHAPCLIYEASLLIEAGRAQDFKGIIVVTAPKEIRVERVMKRDQTSKEAATRMIEAQPSDDSRRPLAHFWIENDQDEENLIAKARNVLDQIISA